MTTSALLALIPPAQRIVTTTVFSSAPSQTLCMVGGFDPSMTDAVLDAWAQRVRSSLTRIDTIYFDPGVPDWDVDALMGFDDTWEYGDIEADDGTPAAPFIVNRNEVTLQVSPAAKPGMRVTAAWPSGRDALFAVDTSAALTGAPGSGNTIQAAFLRGGAAIAVVGQLPVDAAPVLLTIPVANTTALFASHAVGALTDAGVSVGTVLTGACPLPAGRPRAAIPTLESDILLNLVNHTLQVSDNLYAEAFLRILGVSSTLSQQMGVRAAGLAVVRSALETLAGGTPLAFVQHDGSGLSRRDLLTPNTLIAVLEAMRSSQGGLLQSLLPVAGQSGTLSDRFIGTPAAGRVFAKTGTMTAVSALSGYIDSPAHPDLVFSILVCNSDQTSTVIRRAIDDIVLLLYALDSPCVQPVPVSVVVPFAVLALTPLLVLAITCYLERRRNDRG